MAAAFLVVGSSRSTAAPLDDLRARSRRFLRRGLLLSGALHLTLLAAVLWMASRGDEGIVRLNETPVSLVPPIPGLLPPPPAAPTKQTPAPRDDENGLVVPVDRMKPEIPKDLKWNEGPGTTPGTDVHGPGKTSTAGDPGGEPRANVIYDARSVEVPPVPIDAPRPRYPDFEREAGITGRVVMRLLVDADGSVQDVRYISGNKGLGVAARETLIRWRFTPARMNGKVVPVWVEIPVNFVL